jgi:hypothetical protein
MSIVYKENAYQIPRGRVFIDRIVGGALTGERFLGNCPGFELTAKVSNTNHFSSTSGIGEKDAVFVTQVERTGSVTCDNVTGELLALYFGAQLSAHTQTAGSATETLTVMPDAFYQLGRDALNPAGARNISGLSVTSVDGVTHYDEGTDYAVDLQMARLQILPGGGIAAGQIKAVYTRPAASWERMQTGGNGQLSCAVRFIADNPAGQNRDVYLPNVLLTPSGALPLVAEKNDVVQIKLDLEALKPAYGEAIYIDGRPTA